MEPRAEAIAKLLQEFLATYDLPPLLEPNQLLGVARFVVGRELAIQAMLSPAALQLLDATFGEKSTLGIPASHAAQVLEIRAWLKAQQSA